MSEKIPLIVICGPTASGKTSLGIELAKRIGGEIISADSMQIYKGMDIATAKPTAEEMCGIPHHLISIIDPDTEFSVADYLTLAREKIADIHSRGKMPIVVGGTGLYISSLVDNISFENAYTDGSVRKRLTDEAEKLGREAMLDRLRQIDPETAEGLHANNITRIIRALEIYELTGMKFSEHKAVSRMNESPYKVCMVGLDFNDRNVLYDRINRRVDIMAEQGLVEEARAVYESGHKMKTAHQAIGYKELIPYFEGEKTLDECLDFLKMQTRRYAKRQLTWFRRDERIVWIKLDEMLNKRKIIMDCLNIVENSEIM